MSESNLPAPDPEPKPTLVPASAAAPAKTAVKPKRWKKILLWTGGVVAGLILLVILFAPMIVSSVGKGKIVAILNEKLNGTAEVGEFSFSWPASIRLRDFAIKDAQGDAIVKTKEVAVDVALLSAIGGSYIADVRVDSPEILVKHLPDGKFSFETLMKAEAPGEKKESGGREGKATPAKEEKLPFVKANVAVTNGKFTFIHKYGARSEYTNMTAKIGVDSLDKPVTFEAGLGGAGSISVKGEVTLAKDGKLDLEHLHGPVALTLDRIALTNLQPIAAAFAAIAKLEGEVRGTVECRLTSMTSAAVKSSLEMERFSLEGEIVPEPIRLPVVRVTTDVAIDGSGTGEHHLRFEMGDFLVAVVDAKTDKIATDAGTATATMKLDAKLGGLTAALGSLMKLKEGYQLDGSAAVESSATIAIGTKGMGRCSAVASAKLTGLVATDASGKSLPIDPTASLDLKASYDPGGEAIVETCEVVAGTVRISARGGADVAKRTFRDSVLKVDADLDDVARKVASFMDLGFTFGGKVHIDARLEGSGDIAKATSVVNVSQLKLLGFQGKDLGPIDLQMTQSGAVDLRAGGRSTLESFKLVSGLVDIDARAEATDVMAVKNVAGSATFTVKAYPAALNAKLGDFLMGYTLAGEDLVVKGEAGFRGIDVTVKGDFKTRDLVVRGPSLGKKGAVLKDLSLVFDAACNGETLDASARDVTVTCGSAEIDLKEMSAGLRSIVAKLSGSKKGDEFSAKSDVRVQLVTVMTPQLGPKGAAITDVTLDGDVDANLTTFDGDARRVILNVASIEAWMKDAAKPMTVRGFNLVCNGSKTGDAVDLAKLELKSALANGTGAAKITNLMKEGMVANGRFDFRGDVAPLVDLAKVVMADLKEATSSGMWSFVATLGTKGKQIDIAPRLEVRKMTLRGMKFGETPLSVEDADLTLEARALVETEGKGSATIQSCTFTAPGAEVKATGKAGGFLGELHPTCEVHVDARLAPAELTKRLSAFLLGYTLEGEPLTAAADVTMDGFDNYSAKGNVRAPRVKVTMPAADPKAPKAAPRVITQEAMVAEFDVVADLTVDNEKIDIRRCTYVSRTATASAEGEITGMGPTMKANVTVKADAELAQVMKDVTGMMPAEMELGGKARAKFDLIGNSGKINAKGGATVENFAVTMAAAKPGEKTTVKEPKVELACDAIVTMVAAEKRGMMRAGRVDVELRSAAVTSGFCRGAATGEIRDATNEMEFRGLKGDVTYVPDKLGVVIQPWLPGKLTGAEEQKATFQLDGKAKSLEPFALLRGSTGNAKLGIGQFTMTGLAAKGAMDVTLKDQHATTTTNLGVNGGQTALSLDADLRERDDAVTKVNATLKQVGANGEMSPLLQLIHPMFAAAAGTVDGMVEGKIDCSVDLSYRGVLAMDLMTGGMKGFIEGPSTSSVKHWRRMNGRGHFEINGLGLKGSPLMALLLSSLELGALEGIELNPVDFTIRDGWLSYDRPIRMKLSGQITHWTGKISLDQHLDLWWEVPVTEKLVKKYSFLKYWEGKTINVHVTGTCLAPRLEWKELMAELAAEAAKKALEGKGADVLGNLLGRDDKKAKELLAEADKLYDAGKKKDAAAIYKKLHEQYKKTPTYEKNKDRIKSREVE